MTISFDPVAAGTTNINQDGVTKLTLTSTGLSAVAPIISTATPAFSAYKSGNQSISSAVFTLITFENKEYDTTSAFNVSTARYTPQVAGYYQFIITYMTSAASGMTRAIPALYKNGSYVCRGNDWTPAAATLASSQLTRLLYMNGSTDYVEAWGYISGTTPAINGGTISDTVFQAALIARTA